jgi:hypothetical protein
VSGDGKVYRTGAKTMMLPGRCKKCGHPVVLWTPWGWVDSTTLIVHQCKTTQEESDQ